MEYETEFDVQSEERSTSLGAKQQVVDEGTEYLGVKSAESMRQLRIGSSRGVVTACDLGSEILWRRPKEVRGFRFVLRISSRDLKEQSARC